MPPLPEGPKLPWIIRAFEPFFDVMNRHPYGLFWTMIALLITHFTCFLRGFGWWDVFMVFYLSAIAIYLRVSVRKRLRQARKHREWVEEHLNEWKELGLVSDN